MEYHEEHWSWSTCREQRLSAVFEIYSFLSKHPSRKKCSSCDLCIFCLLSSTKSVPLYLVTCWKYKQSHIFISPCRNGPISTAKLWDKEIFHGFLRLCLWLGNKVKRSFLPHTHTPTHPHTHTPTHLQNRVCFVSFLQVRTFHSVWYVRQCTASTVVPKYGPHLVELQMSNRPP